MSITLHDGYLFSLAEAWPFLSDSAVAERTVALRRTPHGLLDESTQRLANALETELRPRVGGISLEKLAALRDRAWMDGVPTGDCRLLDLLLRVAERTGQPHGDRVILRRDGDYGARLERHRWLSLLLPSDLLIAGLYSRWPGHEPPADRISLLSPALAAVLEEAPVVETHLHLGAAIPFPLLWAGLMGLWRTKTPSFHRETAPPPFGSSSAFSAVLLGAAIGRMVMARFLWTERRTETGSFSAFAGSALHAIAASTASATRAAARREELREALGVLWNCKPPPDMSLARLSMLYRQTAERPAETASHRGRLEPARSTQELVARDPLAAWFPAASGRALPETQFLTHALRYLGGAGSNDGPFERLFWQYVRVRNKLFGYLVEQPGTGGLDWFTRHYDRISPLRFPFKEIRVRVAVEAASRDLRLGALEGRTAPESDWVGVRDELRGAARQAAELPTAPGMQPPEVGIILHFLKQSEWKWGRCRRLHADPRQAAHQVRFGAWAYERLRQVIAIERALRLHPELLAILRGIDVAATELAVPTWPLVPLFRRVREAAMHAAGVLERRAPSWRVTPLRVTCHAGEEYRRLVEGLRRVHELVEVGILTSGDRIGHGLCLGDPPDEWARGARLVQQPAEERLDDLLWELDRAARGDFDVRPRRIAFVRGEACRIARGIYGQSVDVDDLRTARRMRHDVAVLDRLGFPFLHHAGRSAGDRASELLLRYLTDEVIFLRGRVPIDVEADAEEVAFLTSAQGWLRDQLAAREITIESNPSSNLLIGNLKSLRDHPSFRIQPLPGASQSNQASLPLSINSDDPVCFATSLADEYAYLYAGLLREGIGAAPALAWLGERRTDGHRSRFTLACSTERSILRQLSGRPPNARFECGAEHVDGHNHRCSIRPRSSMRSL